MQGPDRRAGQPSTSACRRRRSAIGLALGSVNGAFNLDVALTALEESGNGRILSTPRVTTQNNVAAEITQGVQIPIQTVANNTVTVTFQDAALKLNVTPQITAANTVIMQVHARELVARLQPRGRRNSADQHAARADVDSRERRTDVGHRRHLRHQQQTSRTIGRRACTRFRCLAGCSSGRNSRKRAASC